MQGVFLFLDLLSDEPLDGLVDPIRSALSTRLETHTFPLHEAEVKEAILFAQLTLLKLLPPGTNAALSCLVLVHNPDGLLCAGAGDIRAYTLQSDKITRFFADPLNMEVQPHLSSKERLKVLKNALGRSTEPIIQIRHLLRRDLPALLIAPYSIWSKTEEQQLIHNKEAHHLTFSHATSKEQRRHLLLLAALAILLALAGLLLKY